MPRGPAAAVLVTSVLTAGLLVPAKPAHAAATIMAAGLVDGGVGGACSLREAIANADDQVRADCPAGSGPDVIALPGGTYDLDFPECDGGGCDSAYVIMTDVTIAGAGAVARASGGPTVLDDRQPCRHFRMAASTGLCLLSGARRARPGRHAPARWHGADPDRAADRGAGPPACRRNHEIAAALSIAAPTVEAKLTWGLPEARRQHRARARPACSTVTHRPRAVECRAVAGCWRPATTRPEVNGPSVWRRSPVGWTIPGGRSRPVSAGR